MDSEYKKRLGNIGRNALEGRLVDALDELNSLSRSMGDWSVNSAVEKLQDNYHAMLRYVAEGAPDPGRKEITDTITAETMALTMRLSRQFSMDLGTEMYYSTARTTLSRSGETLAKAVNAYIDELNRLETDFDSLTDSRREAKAEQMMRDIFNRIWVTHPLSSDDYAAIEMLMSPTLPFHTRASVISAVGLGHLSYYDTKRLVWLIGKYVEYAVDEPQLGLRALVEALIGMLRYRRRPLPTSVKNALKAAQDLSVWDKDFTTVAIELMRAVGTEGITERMKSGFLNHIGEIDAEMRKKLENGELDFDRIADELNPEWADELSKGQIGQNLRELAEIQAEGGDVFMMSFSQMKRYPFFHDLANWFVPFYESHSSVASADTDDGLISSLLAKMPVLCDSDKYSLILSITSIPGQQREQLMKAMRAQAEQMAEGLSEVEKASGDGLRRNIVNKYVQNIYRFVNLFRSKKDFFNPFTADLHPDLLQVSQLEDNPSDPGLYETIAQFYFKNHFWQEAANAFAILESHEMPEARIMQQLGYAYEKSGQTDLAIQVYEQAEMIAGDSEWTLKRLAKVLREAGNFARAASYYKRLSDNNPDDPNLALALAETFQDAEMFHDAEQAFHKAVYLMPESIGALRGLAWAQFRNKKIERAAETYDKILSTSPEKDDYERAAFTRWASGDIPGAITLFRMSSQDDSEAVEVLDSHISVYSDILRKAGADTSLHRPIIEAIRFLIRQ